MSKTESFEQVMEIARYIMCSDCELMDDFGSLCCEHERGCGDCGRAMADRLRRAHDREIRDTAQQQYDRGFRDAAQKEYHRGFEDGRRSMDAEHRAVAMRLRALPMNKVGYAVNLFDIEYAVCNDWNDVEFRDKLIDLMGGVSDGTTEPMTTDEFIKFIEEDTRKLVSESNQQSDKNDDFCETGDADDTCDSQCRGACAAGDCGCAGKPKEVEHERPADDCGADARGHAVGRDFHELEVSDGRVADDSDGDTGGSYRGVSIHLDGLTAYDVLDNERRKAVCALRRWKPEKAINNDHCGEIQIRLLYQLLDLGGAMMMDGADAAKKVRDRLIHLLGGDKPSGIDVMHEMAECEAECRITDELRKWADGDVWSCKWEEFKAIADRIDEQFDRICAQQEAVLQETIDDVVKEYEHDRLSDQLRIEKLERQRDEARDERDELMKQRAEMTAELARRLKERDDARKRVDELQAMHKDLTAKLTAERESHMELKNALLSKNAECLDWYDKYLDALDEHDNMKYERDNLLDLLRDAVVDFKNASYVWNYAAIVGENITIETERNRLLKERDELQAKLDAIRDTLDG